MMKTVHFNLLCICLLALASCGGGGGGSGSDDLATAVGVPLSTYVVVEIASGNIEAYSSLSDLNTNDKYKTTHIVFRTIASGSAYYGQNPSAFGQQADEVESVASLSKYFIGVFELTQAQWQNIAGSTPWTSINTTDLGLPDWTVADNRKPASNLSYDSITSALSSYSSGKSFSLGLPTNIQWEHACRSGSTDVYSWGASMNTVIAGQYAVVREAFGGTAGPEEVGDQTANALGLYDCHGNVWEMTSDKDIRGGSWYDNITQARCANKYEIMEEVEHFLVGARLVFNP